MAVVDYIPLVVPGVVDMEGDSVGVTAVGNRAKETEVNWGQVED